MDAQDNLLGVVGVDITYRTYGDDGEMVYGIVLPTLVVQCGLTITDRDFIFVKVITMDFIWFTPNSMNKFRYYPLIVNLIKSHKNR